MIGRRVTCALVCSMILAAATMASPALACKGSAVLLKDDFSKVNRAWGGVNKTSSFVIADGKLLGKSDEGYFGRATWGAKYFPDADFCVDVVWPKVDDPENKWFGIMFEQTTKEEGWAYLMAAVNLDGTVVVHQVTKDGWLEPIPAGEVEGLKTEPGAVNTLRLVWKSTEPTISYYVNNKLVGTFDATQSTGRKISLFFNTNGAPDLAIEFHNVVVTK